jgi:oligosaccharyl transferase (archaeosortase A-associated)
MSESRFVPRWLAATLLLIFFGVAIYLRVVLPYNNVFVGGVIKFNTNDAYYYLRQIDNLVHHFPHLISFDPYLNYPSGLPLGPMNFFVYLLGGIAWLIGLGSPSVHLVDTISAYFPAIVGALTIIPVYFIGKALFDRRVGIVAAALTAILPGEFLGRSILGYTDRDTLEILLTSLTMLFLILAIKSTREKQLTFRHLNIRDLSILARPIIYSVLSGILLGLSVLTWRGTFVFVLIILAYIIIRSILDHLKHDSFDYLSFVGIVTFLVALLIFGAMSHSQLYSVALALSLLLLIFLSGLSWLLLRLKIKASYYPLAILGVGLVGLGIFYAVSPSFFRSMLGQFSVFIPTQTSTTVAEMKSILFSTGHFSLAVIWNNYTTGLFLSIISLGVLFYFSFRRDKTDNTLIIVWSLITLVATLALRRIAPFFAISVALLTGYLAVIIYYVVQFIISYMTGRSTGYASSRLMEFTGFKPPAAETSEIPQKWAIWDYYEILGVPQNATHKQIKKAHQKLKDQPHDTLTDEDRERLKQIDRAYAVLSNQQKRIDYDHNRTTQKKDKTGPIKTGGLGISSLINIAVASLAIFFLIFFPNFKHADTAIKDETSLAPSDAWYDSLLWLKDNTPEPFGDAASYYDSYHSPFLYPETAYGVAAWWDYGYWILRISHRLPNCDPGSGARELVARLFTAQNEAEANEIASKLNSKYIIIDDTTVVNKFYAVSTYAGIKSEQFLDTYHMLLNNRMVHFFYFYPQYFQSLAARLYFYDGNEVSSNSTSVISYVEKTDQEGVLYKEVLSTQTFPSYEEAAAYIAKQASGNYRIASSKPLASPMSLERLEHYKLVYSSSQSSSVIPGKIPAVKIFEYVR